MKPKDPVWNYFDIIETGNKNQAKCKDCGSIVSAKSDRLRAHRLKCKKPETQSDTEVIKLQSSESPSQNTPSKKRLFSQIDSPVAEKPEDDGATESTPKRPKIRQRNLSGFTIYTDPNYSKKLDTQIAKLFYACNLPFNMADNPTWRETVKMLRPGYEPPNRKDIGGALLDSVHADLFSNMKNDLKNKNVTLMQDGWSDIHNTPVIATSLQANEKSYFFSAIETGTNKKTAAYCTSIALNAIEEAERELECSISAIVTDNEKKMEVMKQNVKEVKPDIITYGCSAHWLNLLGKDITPSPVINQIVEINKYFRNHHLPGALLDQVNGSIKPQLPGDTRWNSQLHCINTFLKNRPFMLLVLAQNEDAIDARIRNLIQNVGLFNEAKHLSQQLEPVSKLLDSSQSESTSIADACEQWLDLVENENLDPHKDTVQKRFDQAMTPVHFLANILHPRYKGEKLYPEQISKAQDILLEINASALPDLLSYMTESLISMPMENNIVNDFERLRMFSSSIGKMDDLVHDLSLALEDAASHKRSKSDGGHGASSSSTRRHPRKRRGRRKRHIPDTGNISEASQSSIDEAIKDYMENCAQSDSDDLAIAHHIVRLTMPLNINYVPSQVESDSVNECIFSPIRPQRRRKKYKSMAIDPDPASLSQHESPTQGKPKYNRNRCKTVKLPHCSMGTSPMDGGGFMQQMKEECVDETLPGKRKRSIRPKPDFGGGADSNRPDDCFKDEDALDAAMNSQDGSSSTLSSSSSDEESGEDYCVTHEADDEQSDFFHEAGPSSGIPGVIPWWENELVNSGDESMVSDKQFQQILNGSFQHLSRSSQIGFKARMTRIMRHCGREIRFGRRKLKGKIPGYTVQRFIQERHQWNSIQGKISSWYANANSNGNQATAIDSKRQRKTPPPIAEADLTYIGAEAEPIPESNIGNRMLQSMGWTPGQGLGAEGAGIKTPITACLRPHRQGLGCGDSSGVSPSQLYTAEPKPNNDTLTLNKDQDS